MAGRKGKVRGKITTLAVRDRVKELRRVRASELRPSPRNWRLHPDGQRGALEGILLEVGYADALVARELPDGTLELIDGHLRAETTPDAVVPVLVLDVTEAEAAKLLVALDPMAAMAEADAGKLEALLREVETSDEDLAKMLDELARENGLVPGEDGCPADDEPVASKWEVVVSCSGEAQQRELFEELTAEGWDCRIVAA